MSVYRLQKKNLRKSIYFIPAAILYLCCIAGIILLIILSGFQLSLQIKPVPISLLKPADYPSIYKQTTPYISADSAVVLDRDSGIFIYQKNPGLRLSPASTAKLMTSLVGMDYFNLNQELTIKTATVEGTVVGFPLGEKVTYKNLLYGMLLPSGNDAALAVGQNYPGGEIEFVKTMNKKAREIGLPHTHFNDPAGLTDDETYTSVEDLARLASVFLKNPILTDIVRTKYVTISNKDGNKYFVENLNKLLGWHNVDGVKTGHTEGAGDILITTLTENSHRLIIVVMRSDDRFADTRTLIYSIVDSVKYSPIYP